jgi:hypothetical protein
MTAKKPMISCDEGKPFVDPGPMYFVCVEDDDAGSIQVYVQYLPETHEDDGEADRWAGFDYTKDGPWNRSQARTQAEGLARRWAYEISKKWPCDWGSNW